MKLLNYGIIGKIFARKVYYLITEQTVNAYAAVRHKMVKEYEEALLRNSYIFDKTLNFKFNSYQRSKLVKGFESALNEVNISYRDHMAFSSVASAFASKPNNMMRMTVIAIDKLRWSDWSEGIVKETFLDFFRKLKAYSGSITTTSYYFADSSNYKDEIYQIFENFPSQDSSVQHNNYGPVGNEIVQDSEKDCELGILPDRHKRDLSRKADLEIKKYQKQVEEDFKRFKKR